MSDKEPPYITEQLKNHDGYMASSIFKKVDPWTWTLILANIGTFAVPLSTYVLTETYP